MQSKEKNIELGTIRILTDIRRGLGNLMYMEPKSRPASLLDLINHIANDNRNYLGVVGGSLLERINGKYEVIKQFGKNPLIRTRSALRAKSLPIHELNELNLQNIVNDEKEAPVLYRFNYQNRPKYLKDKIIIGLDTRLHEETNRDLDYIILLRQNPYFRHHDLSKEIIRVLATISRLAMDKGFKYQGVKATLQMAQQYQQSIFQDTIPNYDGYDIHAYTQFSEVVGGDFYLLDQLEYTYRIFLADAVHHGLPASLICRTIHDVLWSKKDSRPEAVMKALNERLCMENDGLFATATYLELSKNGNITYINAGHPAPLLFSGGKCRELSEHIMLLGVSPKLDISMEFARMKPGDLLILYSDGITEAFDQNNKRQWGKKRLIEYFKQNIHLSAREMIQDSYQRIEDYCGGNKTDDLSLIAVKKL